MSRLHRRIAPTSSSWFVSSLSLYRLFPDAVFLRLLVQSDVYMFDEPSSYLDVKQRLKAAATIRNILTGEEGGELL